MVNYKRNFYFQTSNLLSSLGGVFSLYLGTSFAMLFELLEIVLDFLHNIMNWIVGKSFGRKYHGMQRFCLFTMKSRGWHNVYACNECFIMWSIFKRLGNILSNEYYLFYFTCVKKKGTINEFSLAMSYFKLGVGTSFCHTWSTVSFKEKNKI